jgi:predicted nuclease with TOPRIM domain
LLNKVLDSFKQEVSFVAKINELHQENAELARELCNWKNEVVTEFERRQMIECEISRLKIIMQQLHDLFHNCRLNIKSITFSSVAISCTLNIRMVSLMYCSGL